MIKPEQIPDEVVEWLCEGLSYWELDIDDLYAAIADYDNEED
jgi:hypothetical protein